MELTLKYYHDFGDKKDELKEGLICPESWDVLRVKGSGMNDPFYIPEDRNVWIKRCLDDKVLGLRARSIAEIVKKDFKDIYSFGVGNARLEYLIKKEHPSFSLKCSDFAPKGIQRLQKVFSEADEISCFDMLKGDYAGINADALCLLYRVDTEFDDQQWRAVLSKMSKAGIKNILFIPSRILTLRRIARLWIKRIVFKLLNRELIFSGFIRTKQRFVSLLSEYYDIAQVVNINDIEGFLLTLKTEGR